MKNKDNDTEEQVERAVPFTPKVFNQVRAAAETARRSFKNEAAILIEEALAARADG